MPNPGQEIITIVDRWNRVVDTAPRAVMRAENLTHRASYILVFNNQNQLFIQKRTAHKDIYPSYWDIAAGGVILAGERYEDGAKRELAEELGLQNQQLTHLFDHYYEDEANKVWGSIFTCTHDGPFILQQEEIESGRFLTVPEVLLLGKREPITPDGLEILLRLGSTDSGGMG